MTLVEVCRNQKCDISAFSRLIFLWLVDHAGMGSMWIAEAIEFYNLEQEAIDTLSEIQAVYNRKPAPFDKLRYAHGVEHVIELMGTRENYFRGRTFPISEAVVNAALEI